MSDFDKQQWQAEQAAQDAALEKQRERERKSRERSARNAQRKLERLHRTLKESGDLTDWEDEFAESVQDRIGEFGSAFKDLQKGRPGDALSFAQKRVVASLNKKVKEARKAAASTAPEDGATSHGHETTAQERRYRPRSSFKSKKSKFTPRVRHIEDDDLGREPPVGENSAPFARGASHQLRAVPKTPRPVAAVDPAFSKKELPAATSASNAAPNSGVAAPAVRPFLRLVK